MRFGDRLFEDLRTELKLLPRACDAPVEPALSADDVERRLPVGTIPFWTASELVALRKEDDRLGT